MRWIILVIAILRCIALDYGVLAANTPAKLPAKVPSNGPSNNQAKAPSPANNAANAAMLAGNITVLGER